MSIAQQDICRITDAVFERQRRLGTSDRQIDRNRAFAVRRADIDRSAHNPKPAILRSLQLFAVQVKGQIVYHVHILAHGQVVKQSRGGAFVLFVQQCHKQLVAVCKAVGYLAVLDLYRRRGPAVAANVGLRVEIVRRIYRNINGRFISRLIRHNYLVLFRIAQNRKLSFFVN